MTRHGLRAGLSENFKADIDSGNKASVFFLVFFRPETSGLDNLEIAEKQVL